MKTWIKWLLTISSALIGSLVFPPFGVDGFGIQALSLVAWIPLLIAIRSSSPRLALYLGLCHGFIFYGLTLSWFTALFMQLAVILWLILACFTSATCWGIAYLHKKRPALSPGLLAFFGATLWTGFDYLRGEIYFLKFPWVSVGVGFGPFWIHPWLGVYASTFLIIFMGLALSGCRIRKPKFSELLGFGILITLFFSVKSPLPHNEPNLTEGISVVAVQAPNPTVEQSLQAALEHDADFIVWPEYSRPTDVRKVPFEFANLKKLSAESDSHLILGTVTELSGGANYNTALTLSPSGVILGEHHKNHPVHMFDDGIIGPDAVPIKTPYGLVGTSICFDNDYQDTALSMTRNGAEFFLVPSLDALNWTLREHLQHSDLARHRAAELGREFVVASSMGITQHIDSKGSRIKTLPQPSPGILKTSISARNEMTFFSRFGWLFGWINLAGALLILSFAIIARNPSHDPPVTDPPN